MNKWKHKELKAKEVIAAEDKAKEAASETYETIENQEKEEKHEKSKEKADSDNEAETESKEEDEFHGELKENIKSMKVSEKLKRVL